ncbi:hypothetical protein Asi03nite_64310 [Actinoplanes siamensis]|uniref:Uncharacterized protein n=1 Tax=Actinoplanes siamensis TaxID=1223317 RepID=A0A919NCY9_9ACTN|nr:hypothetical protein Asi03nite_64310 [Actinoplanes siamensis]
MLNVGPPWRDDEVPDPIPRARSPPPHPERHRRTLSDHGKPSFTSAVSPPWTVSVDGAAAIRLHGTSPFQEGDLPMVQIAKEVMRTVRYALAGNSRTARLCVILMVGALSYLTVTLF